jgi:hydroxymethylpyrimidine kinase/phosphomethylpyrimidine kinase/thiamine-phosphate diphosphorylase
MIDVWTIAGFDPSSGAGILADRDIFNLLGLNSQVLITALTAQNSMTATQVTPVNITLFSEQFRLLKASGWPAVIKIGLLPNKSFVHCVAKLLQGYPGKIIYDPVMIASSGKTLMAPGTLAVLKECLLPRVSVLTPNIQEAMAIIQMPIDSVEKMQQAAYQICKQGVAEVILKGGHLEGDFAQDIWCDGQSHCWLTLPRLNVPPLHGSGCLFSAALAAELAISKNSIDAFVMAKMIGHQALKAQRSPVEMPDNAEHFPWLTKTAIAGQRLSAFAPLSQPLGFYTIINEQRWLSTLPSWGVKTIQWRQKEASPLKDKIIAEVIKTLTSHDIQLFINDDWEIALKEKAYGVHLGQEDLEQCDIDTLRTAGIRLGISTHSLKELARAKALQPSYYAFGPIYPTETKAMIFAAQGLMKLKRWRKWVNDPLVAIGGIHLNNLKDVLSTKVDSVAVVSAVIKAADPFEACQQFLHYFKEV